MKRTPIPKRVAWQLETRGCAMRCVRRSGRFEVQVHDGSKWVPDLAEGPDAVALLERVVSSPVLKPTVVVDQS